MSFGVKNGAPTLQRFINSALKGLEFRYAYIDDILFASPSLLEHM